MNLISIKEFDGVGLDRVYSNENWFVGIKNYKPQNDVNYFDCIEKHNLTDELFILLQGQCVLVIDESEEKDGSQLTTVQLENNKVYCVHQSVWHNTILSKDAKLILVENSNTSEENSEVKNLTDEVLVRLRNEVNN